MTKRTLAVTLTFLLILPLLITVGVSFVTPKISSLNHWDNEYILALKNAIVKPQSAISEKNTLSPTEGDRYIVKFSQDAPLDSIENALDGLEYTPISKSEDRIFAISADNSGFFDEFSHIIEYYELDKTRTTLATVNDPAPATAYDTIGLYSAWDIAVGDESVMVAVLDTGVSREHEDLANANILAGYDAISGKAGVYEDQAGHGTAVIGLIAAAANNGVGIAGVAHGVTILPVKVSSSGTNIYSSDLVRGIRFAADAGAKIINMSIGGYSHSYAEQEAINYAKSKGCILIAAAGNGGNTEYADQPSYPASYEGVISVASCNSMGEPSSFSQRNQFVDISAPGEGITLPAMDSEGNSVYRTDSGTSYSCALVSGVAALVASNIGNYRFESEEFTALLIESCNAERSDDLGHGVINAGKILSLSLFPIVTGVVNGANYSETVTIGFNRGTAVLGDEQIEDGETVVANGNHVLVVTDGDKKKTVRFKLNHTPLSYNFREFSSYAYFEFQRGSATLNGFPYKSKERITTSGVHEFVLTDGDESVSKTVELKYFLPTVYGIADGEVYNTPVEISVIGDGSAYLNGEKFQSRITVSQSGNYVLTVKSGNGALEKDYIFTLNFDSYTHYDADYQNGKAAVDTANGYMCLYGDSLVGVRIYDLNSPEKYKHFMAVGRVYSHAFIEGELYLFGDDGITVLNRSTALLGKESILSTFDFPNLTYYTYAEDNVFGFGNGNIYIIDTESQTTSLIKHLGFECERVFYNNGIFYMLAPSVDNLVRAYDLTEDRLWEYDLGVSLSNLSICFGEGYISAGNRLYNADNGELVFEFADYGAVMISGNKLYTRNRVFDFTVGKEIGSLPFAVYSIATTKDSNWLFGTNAEFASVTKGAGGIYDFGGAESNSNMLSDSQQQTEYRRNLYYEKNGNPLCVAASEINVYMLFANNYAVYGMSADGQSEISPVYLKYKPVKIACSEGYLIVIFANAEKIYIAKEDSLSAGKYISLPYVCTDAIILNGALIAVADGRLIRVKLSDYSVAETKISAKSISVIDGCLLVLSDGLITKYDGNLNKIQFEIALTESGALMTGDAIAVGKSLYSKENGELLVTLNDKILAHGGNVVVTKKGVYDLKSRQYFGTTGITQPKFATVGKGNQVIAVGNGRISVNYCAEGEDVTTVPNVSGVENFGVYLEGASITYDHGVGYVDGVFHQSGQAVTGVGKHIFYLALPCGRALSIQFNIEARLSEIRFVSENITVSVGEKISLHVIYLPEGAASIPVTYKAQGEGIEINENGEASALAVGRYTVTAEAKTEMGVITAKTVITVRDDLIAFNPESGYVIDRNSLLVKGIPAGTTVSELTAMLTTQRNLLVLDENGARVTDYIGTGDKIIITDGNGATTDELYAVITGDTDGDGFITAYDLYVQERILKGYQYSDPFVASADINGNGVLADNDYRTLKRMLFGQIESDLGAPQNGLFGSCGIQTVSTLRQGDIIEAAVCISGAKYARGVLGSISYSQGLQFIEGEAVGWESDCYAQNGRVSFYAFDENGKASDRPFRVLLVLKFKVTASPNEEISLSADRFTVSYPDGCEALVCNGVEMQVSPKVFSDFDIRISNAEGFSFDPAKKDYQVTLPYDSALADVSISCKSGQKVSATSFIIPDSDTQTVVIAFTDESGNTEFYTVTAKRESAPVIDSNCKLKELEIEGHKLTPSFNPEFYNYSITVPYGTEEIKVYCTAQNPAAAVVVGDTTLTGETTDVTVTIGTRDGESLTYTIQVKMLPQDDSSEAHSSASESISSDDDTDGNDDGDGNGIFLILLALLLAGTVAVLVIKLVKRTTENK